MNIHPRRSSAETRAWDLRPGRRRTMTSGCVDLDVLILVRSLAAAGMVLFLLRAGTRGLNPTPALRSSRGRHAHVGKNLETTIDTVFSSMTRGILPRRHSSLMFIQISASPTMARTGAQGAGRSRRGGQAETMDEQRDDTQARQLEGHGCSIGIETPVPG